MPSKLSRYLEGVIEAAWLVALIVVPVFFNVYSSRIFEPDKITLLRSIALLILGAWLVKLIDEGGFRRERFNFRTGLKELFSIPLVAPVLALTGVYLLATIFSITPRVSLLGSYQRLQGFYSFLSYLVIFAALVGNLRRREQIDRLITTTIIASLPVGLYGILQRYGLDPIPWGGDVTRRIAANMGNSIFVAAYLIMVFPLAIGRIISSFKSILQDETDLPRHVTRATIYIFITAIQLIAIYLSGSRGPMLGLLAGAFLIFVLLSLYWRKRWLLLSTLTLAGLIGVFLLVLNIPNGPLESIRTAPWVGRFGQILDTEQRTSQVRSLIWKGAADLVAPHEPIEFPDGSVDIFNFLRPVIGYGPESMYVAYNSFYPAELAKVEKRNASPDRSHNETWDALVMTGGLGLVVYLAVFLAIFYQGLKWLGLMTTSAQRNLFLGLTLGGGVLGSIGLIAWQGIGFFGVGLPFGIILGLILYLTWFAVFSRFEVQENASSSERSLLLIVLLGGLLAHFVEIHFGIAIASTRTYFWTFTGLLLVVGHILPAQGAFSPPSISHAIAPDIESTAPEPESSLRAKRKKARRQEAISRGTGMALPGSWQEIVVGSLITAVLLVTLGYDYISNLARSTSAIQILINSLTVLVSKDNQQSFGILSLIVTSWLAAGILFAAEVRRSPSTRDWLRTSGLILLSSFAVAGVYWLWQAASLANLAGISPTNTTQVIEQIGNFAGLLTNFYVFLLLLVLVVARWLLPDMPARTVGSSALAPVLAPLSLIAVAVLVFLSNLSIIRADISFKMADPFTKVQSQLPVAILVYQDAIKQAPNEDYYYLFLGRAYLEQARVMTDQQERDALLKQAEADLTQAQKINPLNTDHTANLARLYSWWASVSSDPLKSEYISKSADYYASALTLSPNNVVLWGEKAVLELNLLNDNAAALATLEAAIEIDPEYEVTRALLGDYYTQLARSQAGDVRNQSLALAAEQYSLAIEYVATTQDKRPTRYSYHIALASVYLDLDEPSQALAQYASAAELATSSNQWRVYETMARLFAQADQNAQALDYAQRALGVAPESEISRLESLVEQFQSQP